MARTMKPLSEHDGLIGDFARAWKARFGFSPTWTKEEIVGFREKRLMIPELKDGAFVVAFRDVFMQDEFWSGACYPLAAFVKGLDRYLARLEMDPEDYTEWREPAGPSVRKFPTSET